MTLHEAVTSHPSTDALYQLCKAQPPGEQRPISYRWAVFGYPYETIRQAYRDGQSGKGLTADPTSWVAAAYLAGTEAA